LRIDKFLWCTRYYKTRNIAATACKKGHVKINGKSVKPAKDVYIGDKIVVRKNQINYELLILDMPKSRVGAKLVDMLRKDLTPKEAFQNQDILKFAKDYYRKKGEGRPTKKNRRDIEKYNQTKFDEAE